MTSNEPRLDSAPQATPSSSEETRLTTPVPPEAYRALLRLELGPDAFLEQFDHPCRTMTTPFHAPTLEEARAAIMHVKELVAQNEFTTLRAWSRLVAFGGSPIRPGTSDDSRASGSYILTRYQQPLSQLSPEGIVYDVWTELTRTLRINNASKPLNEKLDALLEEIEECIEDRHKPLLARRFSKRAKESFVDRFGNARIAEEVGDPHPTAVYVLFVRELAAEGSPRALEELAFATYRTGSAGVSQDWTTARDAFEHLMKIAPEPEYANALGNIYYDGRTNGGVPEHEKALHYFMYAAAAEISEARYKWVDMLLRGHGTAKNPQLAKRIITDLYDLLLSNIRKHDFRSDFADVALRMGDLALDPVFPWPSAERAYRYYLQARFAVTKRLEFGARDGDVELLEQLEHKIREVFPTTSFAKLSTADGLLAREQFTTGAQLATHWELLQSAMKDALKVGDEGTAVLYRPRGGTDGPTYLVVKALYGWEFFVTLPDRGVADLRRELMIEISDYEELKPMRKYDEQRAKYIRSTECTFDWVSVTGRPPKGTRKKQKEKVWDELMAEGGSTAGWHDRLVFRELGRRVAKIAGHFNLTDLTEQDLLEMGVKESASE
ncbi:tetratricopeptide (TPR) repeat protein [Arcanobacterium wilhelmae]|uniref:Tetratricopeptide (TPR) repeat protein n=1 Tax=Arcanobacterium wilhelmae TaxID=1803177 RepID=A0ABT9NBF2_9ACTO|nr:hypothetical protein [Arcanobacterium wilhelmae]MDP9801025.1 tetratricopeptide (TPR) repeat protein [Arcanobacterium wilhelmae]WFN90384.1 hypothetical protein P8A24_00545 [Arcanobacterium wilhelmae]